MVAATFPKYAMLITNWTAGTRRDVTVANGARCAWWSVDDIDDEQSRDAWREAFGSFQWDHLRDERASMLLAGDDITDTTNAFNDDLLARTRLAAHAYVLNRPPIESGGRLWMLSGGADQDRHPVSVRSIVQLDELFNPYFPNRPAFHAPIVTYRANDWVDDWCADFAALDGSRGGRWLIAPPIEIAFLSFFEAGSRYLDSRLMALVRTIEALIAIPRGHGQQTFATRAAHFAAGVQNHPAIAASGRTLAQILGELYQLRSNAVHGKWPLREMQDAGRQDDVALLEYIAEGIARASIKWAIRNRAAFAAYTTRAALEGAWENGTIPPP